MTAVDDCHKDQYIRDDGIWSNQDIDDCRYEIRRKTL